jgi:hypothetical protein
VREEECRCIAATPCFHVADIGVEKVLLDLGQQLERKYAPAQALITDIPEKQGGHRAALLRDQAV